MLRFVIIFTITVQIALSEQNTSNTSTPDTVGSYGLYNNCPDGSYFATASGIEIHCEPYPWPGSMHELCWRDWWWKIQQRIDFKYFATSNPFNIFSASAGCRSKCFCKLSLDLSKFHCSDKGVSIGWGQSPPPPSKIRQIFQCAQFQLPALFRTLSNGSVELVVSFSNVPSVTNQVFANPTVFYALSNTILQGLVPVNGWILNVNNLASRVSSFDTAEYFLYNLSFSKSLRRLDIINQRVDFQQSKPDPLKFDDLDLILSNFTSSLEFLKLDGFDIITIPDRIPPPFAKSIKSIMVRNAPNFNRLPAWISDAASLVILTMEQISGAFNWDSLKPLSNLTYFALTNTPVSQLPSNLNFARLFPKLELLDLSNLNLTTIARDLFNNSTSLRFLDLSGNDLTTSMPSFAGLRRLEWLGLAATSRVSLIDIDQESIYCVGRRSSGISMNQSDFIDLSNLITLDLSNYGFVNLTDDAFSPLTNLEVVKAACVGWNRLPTTLKYVCRLRELRLPSNDLNGPDAIPSFLAAEFTQLSVVDFRNNSMNFLPQTLLSFSNPNDELIDWIKSTIQENPMNGSDCEIQRFRTAYGSRFATFSGENGTDSNQKQCDAKQNELVAQNRSADSPKMCKPLERKFTIILKSENAGTKVTAGFLITVCFLLTQNLWQ